MLDFKFLSDKAKFQLLESKYPAIECDFLATNTLFPLAAGAIAAGSQAQVLPAIANHPGTIAARCHATNANSGEYFLTAAIFSIVGGEYFRSIFRHDLSLNTVTYLGYFDQVTATTPTNGIVLNIVGGVLTGKVYAGGVLLGTTGTSYTLVEGSWYRAELLVDNDLRFVTFQLFSETGQLLWADRVTSTLTPAQTTGGGILSYVTVSPGAVNLITMDYLGFVNTKPLVR